MPRFSLALAFYLAAAPVLAGHCPADMAEIDAAMASDPSISEADMTEVKTLRAEGEALHKAGDHTASLAKLGKAKAILGID